MGIRKWVYLHSVRFYMIRRRLLGKHRGPIDYGAPYESVTWPKGLGNFLSPRGEAQGFGGKVPRLRWVAVEVAAGRRHWDVGYLFFTGCDHLWSSYNTWPIRSRSESYH